MRFKTLFTSMIATLALAGCSSEDGPNMGNDTNGDSYGYVAVNIVQPKTIGTRAATGDYENGTADENLAREGLFYIFNSDGQVQTINGQTSQRVALAGEGMKDDPAIERIYNAVLVINGIEDDPTDNAKEIICILNAPAGFENAPVNTIADLQAIVADYCTDKTEAGKFVMSNSVYNDETGELVIGTQIEAEKVKTSASEALSDPVDIYVERVVAQVRANEKEGGMTNDGVTLPIDGKDTHFNIVIDGLALTNLSDKANLIKSLDGFTATWTWNDAKNFRSFWELMPAKKDGAEQVTVQTYSWAEMAANDKGYYQEGKSPCFKQYILPNTFSATTDEIKNTAIVVAAHLTDEAGNNADLVWIRGGYTTDEGAKNVIASAILGQFKYYKKTADNKYTSLEPADFDWTNENSDKGYLCYAKLKATFGADNKLYTFTDNTATEVANGAETVNEYLATKSNNLYARKYTDGKCYYFVEIEHVEAAQNGNTAVKGIVRNHIYDLTLNSIEGPGVPVFNPDDKVVPEKPEDEKLFYLGARVNVLDWRIVSQGINFGK